MGKNTFYTLLAIFVSFSVLSQEFKLKTRPQNFETFGFRNDSIIPLKSVKILPESKVVFESKLPYPILFIHGLNSNSETWNPTTDYFDNQYNYTFGGRFDFCLNGDANNSKANTNFYPIPNADIIAFTGTIVKGDYYYVNFDVKTDGSFGTNVLSNQSAIVKQGKALKKAIESVLQITGKDKVVLVGHSMGGLASREYLQNTSNWQADGKHHVAKLLTVGTPHGGSNASDNPIAVFTSVDRQSEAVRDLKSTYYYSREKGKFLFGGTEIQNNSNMDDNSYSPDFYNVDVNCNGVIGDMITGLNQKTIDHFVDYSSVIGRITNFFGTNITTDGVVEEPSSKMGQYLTGLTYPMKIFYFNSSYDIIENHTELPGEYYQLMQGLDEPNVKELAYEISTNKIYNGYTTIQEIANQADQDFYKFSVTDNVTLNVLVNDIVTPSMTGTLLNSSGTAVGAVENNTGNTLNFSRSVTPGTYFLKLTSTAPTSSNYQSPYNFTVTSTLSITEPVVQEIMVYPNPVKDFLNLENISFKRVTITSLSGQQLQVLESDGVQHIHTIDMNTLEKGIYLLTFENEGQQWQTIKVIKE